MVSKENQKSDPSKKKSVKKRPKSPMRKFSFRVMVVLLVLLFIFVGLNIAVNLNSTQESLARFLYKTTKTEVKYENIHLNFFTGKFSGEGIFVYMEKNNLKFYLDHFEIRYSPWILFLGKLKIDSVEANEIYLDSSEFQKKQSLNKTKKTKKASANKLNPQIPQFLQRIKLKYANIKNVIWDQGIKGRLTIKEFLLTSKFGSMLHTSPMSLSINKIKYTNPKVHIFTEKLTQDGFFVFNLSSPRILDESNLISKVQINDFFLSIKKRKKPWLTLPGWDKDLEPIILKYYKKGIPDDRSYLFLKNISFDLQKDLSGINLNSFAVNLNGNILKGYGKLKNSSHKLSLNLETLTPLSISKLPLGQSQFRQSFNKFFLKLKLNGNFRDFKRHSITTNLDAKLIGNNANPEMGNPNIKLNGSIVNGNLKANEILIDLKDGKISGSGSLNVFTGVTQTNFSCKSFDVQTVMGIFTSIKIPSVADCNGTISGKVNNPNISIDMSSKDAIYEFLHFGNAKGHLNLKNENLSFKIHSIDSEIGEVQLNLDVKNVFNPFKQIMTLKSNFKNLIIKDVLASKSLNANMDGIFNLKRIAGNVKANGNFTAKNFTFFEHLVGEVKADLTINKKHLKITPIHLKTHLPKKEYISRRGFEFFFDDLGYKFKGQLFDDLNISGEFKKANKELLNLKIKAQKSSLEPFTSILPFQPLDSSFTGNANITYNITDPLLSKFTSNLSDLYIKILDGEFKLSKPARINYSKHAFQFQAFKAKLGQGEFSLQGSLGLKKNSNLKIKGDIDFNIIADFNPFISESEQPISVDLSVKEDIFKPKVYGQAILKNDTVNFRSILRDIEDLSGTLKFNGYKVQTDELTMLYDDAPLTIKGFITSNYTQITSAKLDIQGNEVPIHLNNGLDVYSDVDLKLLGSGNSMRLEGKINIIDGQMVQNFGISNFVIKPKVLYASEEEQFTFLNPNLRLSLTIKNTGDFIAKSDLAVLDLNADLELKGTISSPYFLGQVDFTSGKVNAFGVNFQNATGYAQFRKKWGLEPSINLTATREIQEYEITAKIDGLMDNLRLKLSATPSLEKREILSILFYGQLPDQLDQDKRIQFTQTAAISSLANVLSKPLYDLSGLDVFKVSARQNSSTETIPRLSLGKRLSNRFSFYFTTDIGIDDPERAFELEYQIFDNFYFISAKDIGDRYRFDINYRFEIY